LTDAARAARPRPVKALVGAAFAVLAIAGLYVLLPRLAGLDDTWRRLDDGDGRWLVAALGLELLSFASYFVLFRAVFGGLPFGAVYEITLAGVAATRLFATAGAGGVVLTMWALARSGWTAGRAAVGMSTFLVLLYAPYMAALVLGGIGLSTGALPGPAPPGVTLVPAAFGALVVLAALLFTLVPADLGVRRRRGRIARALAAAPARFGSGVRGALAICGRRDVRALGAIGWWAFDIATLGACFEAFGGAPAVGVLVMGYFVGMLGNLLPLPGGVGGVDGGMIGTFVAFGVSGGLALVAVLAYRAFSFWLPTIPGIIAYFQLRRRLDQAEPEPG
jgi:putative heme transporter